MCPHCSYVIDYNYCYCSSCGTPRPGLTLPAPRDLDEEARVTMRLLQLDAWHEAKKGELSKKRTAMTLAGFLARQHPPVRIFSASPHDIRRFLVYKDHTGTRLVHLPVCRFFQSKTKKPDCDCPSRSAFNTVRSYVFALRSWFNKHGIEGTWNPQFHSGNPCASYLVDQYMRRIQEEQAHAGVGVQQAVPVFIPKVFAVLLELDNTRNRAVAANDAVSKLMCLQEAFFVAVEWASGMRGQDALHLRTDSVIAFPKGDGLLFNMTWGKTLREASSEHVFGIARNANPRLCAVKRFYAYTWGFLRRGIDLAQTNGDGGSRYLFPSIKNIQGQWGVSDTPVTRASLTARFVKRLKDLNIYEGETLHSFRSGMAIDASLRGNDLLSIMGHLDWKSSKTAAHYTKLFNILSSGGVAASQAKAKEHTYVYGVTPQTYEDVNALRGACCAFPSSKG